MNTLSKLKLDFFIFLKKYTAIDDLPTIEFNLNTDEHKQQFGDITTNAAMILAKTLGKTLVK